MPCQGISILHDNTRAHCQADLFDWLWHNGWEVKPCPLLKSLVPNGPVKQQVTGKQHAKEANMKQAVISWL